MLAGVVAGFKTSFYWVPYHVFFLRKSGSKLKRFGKNTGTRFFLTRLISGIGPALGGLIIVKFGFPVLFMVSIVVLIIAALPIAVVVHEWEHKKHDMVDILKKYLLNKKYTRITMSYFGEGVDNYIYSIFWPILLFFVLKDFDKVGYISSISFMLASVAVLFVGRIIDRHGEKRVHGFGAFINSLLYLPRMFFTNPLLFYSLDLSDRFVSGAYSLPIMSLSYEKAKKLGGSNYLLYRELCIHGGIIIILAAVMLAIQALSFWKWVFFIAMAGSLMTYLIETDKN
jgi:MFS family permease